MSNIKEVLLNESKLHPYMEITDYVKLIFQHVNGGNHLLKSENEAKNYLNIEYLTVIENKNLPLYEDIGNDIVRINIARFKADKLNINSLFEAFKLSSIKYQKDIQQMEEAFTTLKELARENKLSINLEELEAYLKWYRDNDYPVTSHSELYKKHYDPHYRIINKQYLNIILNK